MPRGWRTNRPVLNQTKLVEMVRCVMQHKRFEVSGMHRAIQWVLLLFGVQCLQSFEHQSDTFHSRLSLHCLVGGGFNRGHRSQVARRFPQWIFCRQRAQEKRAEKTGSTTSQRIDPYFTEVQIAKVCYMVQHLGG